METLLNMSLGQLCVDAAGAIVLLSIFIEITPIKINPVSHFLGWLGKKINRDTLEKINELDKKVDSLETHAAVNCRVRILRFGDELRRNVEHSKESYDQVLLDIDEYERYCAAHPEFENNKTVLTKEKILDVYSDKLDDNAFL